MKRNKKIQKTPSNIKLNEGRKVKSKYEIRLKKNVNSKTP